MSFLEDLEEFQEALSNRARNLGLPCRRMSLFLRIGRLSLSEPTEKESFTTAHRVLMLFTLFLGLHFDFDFDFFFFLVGFSFRGTQNLQAG